MKKLTAVLIAVFLFPASFALGGEHSALASERPSLVNDDLAFAFHGDVPLRAQFMSDAELAKTQGRALPLVLILAARLGVALAPHIVRAAKVVWQASKGIGRTAKIVVTHPKTKKRAVITANLLGFGSVIDTVTGGHLADGIKDYLRGKDSALTPEQKAEIEAILEKGFKKFAEENQELTETSKNQPDSLKKFIEEYKKAEETPDEETPAEETPAEETDSSNSTSTTSTATIPPIDLGFTPEETAALKRLSQVNWTNFVSPIGNSGSGSFASFGSAGSIGTLSFNHNTSVPIVNSSYSSLRGGYQTFTWSGSTATTTWHFYDFGL